MFDCKWVQYTKRADFDAIAEKYNIDKVLARIIRNRDITEDNDIDMFLNGTMDCLHDGMLMKDMGKAADILKDKIDQKKSIRIIGDYDVDGICATYILLKGIRTLGGVADTVIPHRILDGYGLNENLILSAHEDQIDTILTCDNGIAAKDQIKLAKDYGMTVIVTDHHEVPYNETEGIRSYILPEADCVVDPKQEDCAYPYKKICGAFIAFKLISILLDGKYPEVIEELIPFAALATNCDVMDLLDENRIIVKEGLRLMEEPINPGLKALKIALGLGDKKITAYHLGFVIGPTINATGRLDTAKRALELFSAEDFKEACTIAVELKDLNESRKKITEDGAAKAVEIVESSDIINDRVIVVYLPDCHESVAGIIAGRIKERYFKPTIILTNAEEGVKGSGRSIEAYNMFEELSKVKDLFTKFGGHPMAAGLSLAKAEDIDSLRRRLNENCTLSKEDMAKKLMIDVAMPLSYASMSLIESFELLEPCGVANPHPMFATKRVSLLEYTKRGKSRVIGKLRIADEYGKTYDCVYFDDLDEFEAFIEDTFGKEKLEKLMNGRCTLHELEIMMAYQPDINEYNGRRSVQIVMKYYGRMV